MEGCLEFMWTFIAECIFAGFELAFVCLVQIGRNRWQKWFDLQQVPDRPQPFRMLECTRTLDSSLLICSLSIAPPSLFSSKYLSFYYAHGQYAQCALHIYIGSIILWAINKTPFSTFHCIAVKTNVVYICRWRWRARGQIWAQAGKGGRQMPIKSSLGDRYCCLLSVAYFSQVNKPLSFANHI